MKDLMVALWLLFFIGVCSTEFVSTFRKLETNAQDMVKVNAICQASNDQYIVAGMYMMGGSNSYMFVGKMNKDGFVWQASELRASSEFTHVVRVSKGGEDYFAAIGTIFDSLSKIFILLVDSSGTVDHSYRVDLGAVNDYPLSASYDKSNDTIVIACTSGDIPVVVRYDFNKRLVSVHTQLFNGDSSYTPKKVVALSDSSILLLSNHDTGSIKNITISNLLPNGECSSVHAEIGFEGVSLVGSSIIPVNSENQYLIIGTKNDASIFFMIFDPTYWDGTTLGAPLEMYDIISDTKSIEATDITVDTVPSQIPNFIVISGSYSNSIHPHGVLMKIKSVSQDISITSSKNVQGANINGISYNTSLSSTLPFISSGVSANDAFFGITNLDLEHCALKPFSLRYTKTLSPNIPYTGLNCFTASDSTLAVDQPTTAYSKDANLKYLQKCMMCGSYQNDQSDVCSGKGSCLNSTCFCDDGYEAKDNFRCVGTAPGGGGGDGGLGSGAVVLIIGGSVAACICSPCILCALCVICIPVTIVILIPVLLVLLVLCCVPTILICFLLALVCCVLLLLGVICIMFVFFVTTTLRSKNKGTNFDELENIDRESTASIQIRKELYEINYGDITVKSLLGEGGSHSSVYLAKWNGKDVAFKCFRIQAYMNDKKFQEFENEAEILLSVKHPNILSSFGCTVKLPRVGIVMEFCENGDLRNYFTGKGKDTPLIKRVYMLVGVSSAMQYLHGRKIIHRDVKCENVLLDGQLEPKVMDFGASRFFQSADQTKTRAIGTSTTMAPELVKSGKYSTKCDVFSFAIVLWELVYLDFEPYKEVEFGIELKVANDPNFRPKFDKSIDFPTPLRELAENCWQDDPDDRPAFSEVGKVLERYYEDKKKK